LKKNEPEFECDRVGSTHEFIVKFASVWWARPRHTAVSRLH
jgi:hypothetical protein